MSQHSPYSWFNTYKFAALETDLTELANRIEDALSAIETRLDGPTKLDEVEFNDIQSALYSLRKLSEKQSKP